MPQVCVAGLLAMLLLPVVSDSAWAQGGTEPDTAVSTNMPSVPTERNVIQEATMSYGSGMRNVKKAHKLQTKAAEASGEDKAQLEEKSHQLLEKAAGDFSNAIRNNPKLHKAYVALGDTLVELDQSQDAVGVYSKAIEMEPTDWDTVLSRGQAQVSLDDIGGAVGSYQQLQPGDGTKASELLGSIKGWVEYQQANPGKIPPEAVQEVATWVGAQEGASS